MGTIRKGGLLIINGGGHIFNKKQREEPPLLHNDVEVVKKMQTDDTMSEEEHARLQEIADRENLLLPTEMNLRAERKYLGEEDDNKLLPNLE